MTHMLRSIMVPVRGDGMVSTVLGHAAELAKQHGSHVSVVHCRAPVKDMMPPGIPLPEFARKAVIEQASELANQQEDHLRRILHRLAREFGLEEGAPREGAATCAFSEEHGKMADVIKHKGRLSDMIVVAKPQRERNLGFSTLKSAIYSTGRPVLMCPGDLKADESFGRHVAIGWNGSLPAARAVSSSMPVVRAAEKVTILTGGKVQAHGPEAEELVEYYRVRGVTAEPVLFDTENPAKALLAKTMEVGASLLIAGAYSHSHESEMLFGGNTQKIVDQAEIPILMAH